MLNEKQINYLVDNRENLLYRKFLIDTFTPPLDENDTKFKIPLRSEFYLEKGMIENYNKNTPILTNIGQYIGNYILLVDPFKHIDNFTESFQYINEGFTKETIGKIHQQIKLRLYDKSLTVDDYGIFLDNLRFIAHFNELHTASFSNDSIVVSDIVLKRAQELLNLHKEELLDPNLDENEKFKIIINIEDELIALDRDTLKDDIGIIFYDAIGSKAFDVHRKTLFLMQGVVERFNKDEGTFDFIESSLLSGWKKKDFAAICNTIVKGSSDRGIGTREGGYLAKLLYRVFSSLEISEIDCGTTEGREEIIKDTETYLGRYIIEGDKTVVLTIDNINQYLNKKVILRDPFHCKVKNGLCYHCTHMDYELLEQKTVVDNIASIGNDTMNFKMKSMHGSKVNIKKFKFEDYFISF
jgi:hypothetical protein